jgi:1-acyl-sn-glycerol-3-phosphate acyltransferase
MSLSNLLINLYYPITYIIKVKDYNKNLPQRYILACNHPKKVDGFLLWLLFNFRYKKQLKIFAYETYFDKAIIGFHLKAVGCIKVTKDNPGDSLEEAFNIKDRSFCMFIEGKSTKIKAKPKTGCVRLSLYHKLPIIPVKIVHKRLFKEVILGNPVYPSSKDIKKESKELLNKIYKLK